MQTLRNKDAKAAKAYFSKKKNRKKKQDFSPVPTKYADYIKSKHWERRRKEYLSKHGAICAACNSTNHIQVHHIVYGNFGKEPDTNLVSLCKDCHDEFHKLHSTKGNMRKETLDYLVSIKRDLAILEVLPK